MPRKRKQKPVLIPNGENLRPGEPTKLPPGKTRLELYRRRIEAGETLHHKDDKKWAEQD